MQLKVFYFNELRVCTYVLWDETKECIIVDPGCESASEQQRLQEFIANNQLKPVMVVNTHAHFDHVLGNLFVVKTYSVPSAVHEGDTQLLARVAQQSAMFGFAVAQPPMPSRLLTEEEPVRFGHSQLQVLHTPGHSPGGICLYAAEDKFLLSGDTLFQESIGRTDLSGGNYEQLINSIRHKLMTLPDDVKVFPGHGPATSIGEEKRNNPFIAC
ncbi:MAG: MBL fold metallo-hydrolase [Prevotellaceae bacterium]|jgi:glyoxylase-like metal-dependent hydrolase (beta-lactamase superfamily II)|nr:MBL fold metallo-hydrolase [Prevotellaceae bacterium]